MAVPETNAPFPIILIHATLPAGATYNPQSYLNAVVERLLMNTNGGLAFGQLGGGKPQGVMPEDGLWFGDPYGNTGVFQKWNSDLGQYIPALMACGQYVDDNVRESSFICGATKNQKIITPDKAGTMMLLDDDPQNLGLQTFGGSTSIHPDWTTHQAVYFTLDATAPADTSFTINADPNAKDGQTLDFFIETPAMVPFGTGHAFHLTWPYVLWNNGLAAGATDPSPIVDVNTRVLDHFQLHQVGNILWGEVIGKNYQIATGTHLVIVTFLEANALVGSNRIDVNMSGNLTGGTLDKTKWIVMKNGNAQNVLDATANGDFVFIHIDNALKRGNQVTVQYTGNDLKSISNIAVAPFGPVDVTVETTNGGVHGPGTNGGPTHIPINPP